jgi:Holliday junction resolvase RusA-like endonuclease
MKQQIELIGLNVPSKKNSKIITKNKRVISSKLVQYYERWATPLLKEQLSIWQQMVQNKPLPLKVSFYFYRDSKRKWDFVNIVQVIADLMQKEKYLVDDDTKNFIPLYAGEEVTTKKEAGVIITII